MKIIGNNVQPREADLIAHYIQNGVDVLRSSGIGHFIPENAGRLADDVLEVKRRERSPSRAAARVIRINLGYWQINNPDHIEYKRFNRDPVIGRISCHCVEDHWLVSSMHELSHHIQYAYGEPKYGDFYSKPHGKGFQLIYGILRSEYVNPSLTG